MILVKIKLRDKPIMGRWNGMALPPWQIRVYTGARDPMKIIRHEWTHLLQGVELWYIGFYLLYFVSWIWVKFKYRDIWFEREAYDNDENPMYNGSRKKFAWRDYIRTKCDSIHECPDHPVTFSHLRRDGTPVRWCAKCFQHIHKIEHGKSI